MKKVFLEKKILSILTILSITVCWAGCGQKNEEMNSNQIMIKKEISLLPITTATPAMANIKVLGEDKKNDRAYLQAEFQKKLKLVSVLEELTKLSGSFVGRELTEKEFGTKKTEIFRLIDNFSNEEKDLITFAKLCQVMKKHRAGLGINYYLGANVFDIAFFYSVKTVANKHKTDKSIMDELNRLKEFLGDSEYGDFLLALDGKEPVYLYGQEP